MAGADAGRERGRVQSQRGGAPANAKSREMQMHRIEWIEIPRGESLLGLSEEQKELIRRSVYSHYDVNGLNARDQQMIEEVKEKLRLFAVSRTEEQLNRDLVQGIGPQLSSEEQRIGRQFTHIFQIEAQLRRIGQKVINLDTFYIARFPITAKLWTEQYGLRPTTEPKVPAPANWYMADKFCHEVGGRLPTEIEWEKAARGAEGWLYPWGNQWDSSCGNFGGNDNVTGDGHGTKLTAVDAYPSGTSSYGVWDLCGNVQEWTMTTEWLYYDKREYMIKKAYPVKSDSELQWYEHLLFHRSLARRIEDFYTGFRPVMDQWQREHWPGLRIESKRNSEEE